MGFKGFVMSDWGAAHSTALDKGLDMAARLADFLQAPMGPIVRQNPVGFRGWVWMDPENVSSCVPLLAYPLPQFLRGNTVSRCAHRVSKGNTGTNEGSIHKGPLDFARLFARMAGETSSALVCLEHVATVVHADQTKGPLL